MEKLPFEISHRMWVEYMVWRIFCKYAYPALESSHMPIKSYEEWASPDMYYIDGINKNELPIQYKGREYLASQFETLKEWASIK